MKMPQKSYIICATPRTGSTLLCSMLKSSGVAGVPESYFRSQDLENWADKWGLNKPFTFQDFLNATIRAGQTDNNVFAVRIMWGTMEELVQDINSLYPDETAEDIDWLSRVFGNLQFVYLKRQDIVAQAVSRLRAEQTDIWHVADEIEATAPVQLPQYDCERIRTYIEEAQADNESWQNWFQDNQITPHSVIYEDLANDPTTETLRVLDYLGQKLPENIKLTTANKRMADQTSREWIERYKRETSRK